MKNTRHENLAEHSFECAVIAHALAVIGNTVYEGTFDEDKVALYALYHDVSEIYTGDLPTPIKYYNPSIKKAYKDIELAAQEKLLAILPEKFRGAYDGIVKEEASPEIIALVKAADKLCAYIKCVNERLGGNTEFAAAEKSIWETIEIMDIPEVAYFVEYFLPAFGCNLDEL